MFKTFIDYFNLLKKEPTLHHLSVLGGLISIFIDWLAFLTFYIAYPHVFALRNAVSDFAYQPRTELLFLLYFSLAVISFWVFVKWGLDQHYETPVTIFSLSLVSLIIALITAPFTVNHSMIEFIHDLCAFLFAVGFVWGTIEMYKHHHDKYFKQVTKATAGLCLIIFISIPVFSSNHIFLLFEIGIALLLQYWILVVTLILMRFILLK